MRVRVVTRGIRGLLSVPDLLTPWKFGWVAFQLWSHKILRWLVPYFLLLLFAGNILLWQHPFYGVFLAGQVSFYFMALFASFIPIQHLWKPLGIPLFFCTLNAAAFFS